VLQYDFEQSIGYWLLMSARGYERALNELLAPQGITYRQCQVLGWLALEGALSQTELADRMAIEPPTLVGILDRMERDGWIFRDDCPTDRRKKLVRPTAEAEPVWATVAACAKQVRARATRGLTAAQLATLKELLGVIQENLNAKVPAKEAG
jgi:MarR family transcriptional regulator, transcriptional regulator for hemolysin